MHGAARPGPRNSTRLNRHPLDATMIGILVFPGDVELKGGNVRACSVSWWPMRRSWRWLIICIGLPLYTAVLWAIVFTAMLFLLGNPPKEVLSAWQHLDFFFALGWWALLLTGPVVLIAIGQALMIGPLIAPQPDRRARGRSLALSLLICAFVASMLVLALLFALLELVDVWEEPLHMDDSLWGGDLALSLTLPALLVGGIIWSLLFLFFTRGRCTFGTIGRIIVILLAVTVVDTLLIVPIDVVVRQRADPYILSGTFQALHLMVFAVLWLAGPGALIVFTRRRRRYWAETHCLNCGYEKGPSPGEKCPECGYAWKQG